MVNGLERLGQLQIHLLLGDHFTLACSAQSQPQ